MVLEENNQQQKALDEYFMRLALAQAETALSFDEVPIGALLIKDKGVVAAAYNQTRHFGNVVDHAEKLVIKEVLKNERFLYDYTLYVTLEPCLMCTGYIILARVGRVVYGADDPKAGCCGSIYNALQDKSFNHSPILKRGILKEESADLLKKFFAAKRKKN